MNKNSNTYQIVYSAVMVLLVGVLLAGIYMWLKPRQDENVANDKRKQILSAVHLTPAGDQDVKTQFEKYITDGFLINTDGTKAEGTDLAAAFDVDMKKNMKADEKDRKLPVFVCNADDGSKKYVIPVYGAGLWGPIWGYVAVESDGKSVYGAYFSHESETPGLGAEIGNEKFQKQFNGKKLYVDGEFKSLGVMKAGQKPLNGAEYVDAISGGTITSRGVQAMLETCMTPYDPFLKSLAGDKGDCCGKDCDGTKADCDKQAAPCDKNVECEKVKKED